MGILHHLRERLQGVTLQEVLQELRWIYQYARRYRRQIALYLVLGLLSAALGLGASLLSRDLTNAVIGDVPQPLGQVIGLGLLYVLMGLASIGMGALNSRVAAVVGVRVQNEVQADIFRQFLRADWQSLQQFHSGDLLNRLTTDTRAVSASVFGLLPNLAIRLFQFAASLGLILWYDPVMACLALLSAPVMLLASQTLMGGMRRHQQEVRQAGSKLMSYQEESLQNVQSIKAFGLARTFGDGLRREQRSYEKAALSFNKFSIFTSSFMSLVGQAVSYTCLVWGIYRLWSGHIDIATMVMFLQLAGQLSSAFSSLVGLVPGAVSATVAARRILSVLDLPAERIPGWEEQAQVFHLMEMAQFHGLTLRVEGVTFAYQGGEHRVLEEVSLTAGPGEIVALIGASGGGKTTLLRVLLGLVAPQSGTCTLSAEGEEPVPVSTATRPLFSYVPQEKAIFSGTIAESMRLLAPTASDEEIEEALRAACAYDFVRELPQGIHTPLGERGAGLSEGQVQRLSIARAILRDAPILLLDEATSALDVETERQVLRNIFRKDRRRTCIVTSHRPSVFAMCSRAYRLNGERLEQLSERELQALRRGAVEGWG
ncbi:ABC transporter ATP-binding protein [uncultured Intestinimonas sp.]|uniref:ABC transporter ATP-binding protein n=1 Tax=uncultured Intestinimonas sp. TaxID=1689265 RepID=UPI0025F8F4B4|nr:ABC transporter ATP-binding protein [uncultured Intestinimonas sp.]